MEIDKRTAAFQVSTAAKHSAARRSSGRGAATTKSSGPAVNESEDGGAAESLRSTRVLVDPQMLRLVDPEGRIEVGSGSTQGKTNRNRQLAEPNLRSKAPQNRLPIRGYSDLNKEDVGMELAKELLGSDRADIVDIRTQRGVGADAVDMVGELRSFFELKVSARDESDTVTLTNSEVKRALSTKDFFLVIVSNVEGVDARPKVRVVVDPLNQLNKTDRGSITLSGVRKSKSIVYEFAPVNDPVEGNE